MGHYNEYTSKLRQGTCGFLRNIHACPKLGQMPKAKHEKNLTSSNQRLEHI